MFGNDISDNTNVYVVRPSYFQFVNQLLANESQAENMTRYCKLLPKINIHVMTSLCFLCRIMNNYIIWRVVDEYVHHLSWDYKYASFMFYEEYTGIEKY